MTLISDMAEVDAEVLEAFGQEFLVDSVSVIGIFQDSFVDQPSGDNTVEGREILFTCRESALPSPLVHRSSTFVHVPADGETDLGSFVFLRAEPDESGLVKCILGS